MAAAQVHVDLHGLRALQDRIANLSGLQLTRMLDQVGATVVEQTLRRFDRESGPTGFHWRPLQDATVLRKLGGAGRAMKKRGGFKKAALRKMAVMKILQDSSWQGGLISTIHHVVKGVRVEIGSNKVYSAIHQFGGAEVGRPGIPARPYLGIGPADEREIQAVVESWLDQHSGLFS